MVKTYIVLGIIYIIVLLTGWQLMDVYFQWVDTWSIQRAIWSAGVFVGISILSLPILIKNMYLKYIKNISNTK